MKDVYVIKVKTKPPLSSLYPSERRYSASTVGGLSLVHLGLSILSFLLGTLAGSLQGPVLSLACLVPFVSGLFAWRRWYMDKNITYFFYGSLFSLVVSTLCGVATVFDVAGLNENQGIGVPAWKLEKVFEYPEERLDENDKIEVKIVERNETKVDIVKILKNVSNCNDTSSENEEIAMNCTEDIRPTTSPTSELRYFNAGGIFSFWRRDSAATNRSNLLLDINVLVTCILEICWSLLSVKISLFGMRNRAADVTNYDHYNNDHGYLAKKRKPRAPNPGVIENHLYHRDGDIYDENLHGFSNNYRGNSTIVDNSIPRLPLPESKIEFRERVERFLANQAAHRIVEGSCS